MANTVTINLDANIATVTLDRAHGNAINVDLVDDLTAALETLAADDAVRAVQLTGAGKLFSPGLDLQELIGLDRRTMSGFLERFNAGVLALYEFPKPLVAAMRGHAVAGGCVFAMTTDWRILHENAVVGLNEIRVGVPFPYGVAMILRDSVPKRHLEEIVVFGRNYRGEEARAVGLVHDVAADDAFDALCAERLADLASKDAQAFAVTKRYLREATVQRIRAGEAQFHSDFLDCWFSDGTQARIGAIVAELQARKS